MEFINAPAAQAAQAITDTLTAALQKHSRVLWLVCGGSSIAIEAQIMQALPEDLTAKLHIMLTDERYGEVDHADSNFRQLREAGFETKLATFIPTLEQGKSIDETAASYAAHFDEERAAAGFIVALFGVGPDGHIAGALPGTVAAKAEDVLAIGYHTDTFDRLTLTFPALKSIDVAFATVYGDSKKPTLEQLRDTLTPLVDQPCQILKQIPESYVYNDTITGGTATV